MGRKFVGAELKQSYFSQAIVNLETASQLKHDLFNNAVNPKAIPNRRK
jgi:hypothetical protein